MLRYDFSPQFNQTVSHRDPPGHPIPAPPKPETADEAYARGMNDGREKCRRALAAAIGSEGNGLSWFLLLALVLRLTRKPAPVSQ